MIRNWVICGPFRLNARYSSCAQSSARKKAIKAAWNVDRLGGEQRAEPKAGDVFEDAGKPGTVIKSRLVTCYAHEEVARSDVIRLDDRAATKDQIFYATTYIYSAATTACYVLLASKGPTKVWVNHTPMYDRYDNSSMAESVGINVNLQAGWNVLMLKIKGVSPPNDFRVAISDTLGWDAERTDMYYSTTPELPPPPEEPVVVPPEVPVVTPPETPAVVPPEVPVVTPPSVDIPALYQQYVADMQTVAPTQPPATYQEFHTHYAQAAAPAGEAGNIFGKLGGAVGLSEGDAKIACVVVAVVVVVIAIV